MIITKKIKFDDKERNWVSADSKYVVTTKEINEIKNVVNALTNEAAMNVFTFSDICRYIAIQIPNDFKIDSIRGRYLVIELADNAEFRNAVRFNSTLNDHKMYMFMKDTGAFMHVNYVTSDLAGSTVILDISNLELENPQKKRYARYDFAIGSESGRKEGMMIGALGVLPDQDWSIPIQMAEYEPENDIVDIILNETGTLRYSVSIAYRDGTTKSLGSNMEILASGTNEDETVTIVRSGATIQLGGFIRSGKKCILLKVSDGKTSTFKIVQVDVSVPSTVLGISTDLSKISSTEIGYLVQNNLESGASQDITASTNIFGRDIVVSPSRKKIKASSPDSRGSIDILSIGGIEKAVEIVQEKIIGVNIYSGNATLKDLEINTTYSLSFKALMLRDGIITEIPATVRSLAVEGIPADTYRNLTTSRITTTDHARTKMAGFFDVKIAAGGCVASFQKPFSINGYSLDRIEIQGDDTIADVTNHVYNVVSWLTDGITSSKVDPLAWHVDVDPIGANILTYSKNPAGQIILRSGDTLYDYIVEISAYYHDPMFTEEEAITTKNVLVQGGVTVTTSGKILYADGTSDAIRSSSFTNKTFRIYVDQDVVEEEIMLDRDILVGMDIDDSFIIGLSGFYADKPFELTELSLMLETRNGSTYEKKMTYMSAKNVWIPEDGVPEKAARLTSLKSKIKVKVSDYQG